jgi:hypothetical protein
MVLWSIKSCLTKTWEKPICPIQKFMQIHFWQKGAFVTWQQKSTQIQCSMTKKEKLSTHWTDFKAVLAVLQCLSDFACPFIF